MHNNPFHILSTKALLPNQLETARQLGLSINEIPVLDIQPVISKSLEERISTLVNTNANVVFTSANAVKPLHTYYLEKNGYSPNWNIYCLQAGTLKSVQQLFPGSKVMQTAPDGKQLAEMIVRENIAKEIVFFCGNQRRDELPGILKAHGINLEEWIVYTNNAIPKQVDTRHYDAVLFFSPSGIRSFFSMNTLAAHTVCVAIGPTTASAIGSHTNNTVITAVEPSPENMLSTVSNYLKQHSKA